MEEDRVEFFQGKEHSFTHDDQLMRLTLHVDVFDGKSSGPCAKLSTDKRGIWVLQMQPTNEPANIPVSTKTANYNMATDFARGYIQARKDMERAVSQVISDERESTAKDGE